MYRFNMFIILHLYITKNDLRQFQGSGNFSYFKRTHILINLKKPPYTFHTTFMAFELPWDHSFTKSHPIHDILLTAVWINLRHVMLLFFRCMRILLYWINKKSLNITQFILSTNQWIVNTNVMCIRCTPLWGRCLKISNLKNDVLLKNEWQLLLWETTGYFVGKVWCHNLLSINCATGYISYEGLYLVFFLF